MGRPNVGKSSLLNFLTQSDTALVTDIPGTTRDSITAELGHAGQLISVTDTAGLRDSSDIVENMGMQRTRAALEAADLVWLMVEAQDDTGSVDRQYHAFVPEAYRSKCFVVANKSDLGIKSKQSSGGIFVISAHTGEGVDKLLNNSIEACDLNEQIPFSARKRHIDALKQLADHLTAAAQCPVSEPELMAENLRYAQNSLAAITGQYSNENLLDAIFRGFCLGK